MRSRKALRQSEKEERKRAICASAHELYRKLDFDEIKMTDIAETTGLAKGTLFLYFRTKEELFLELLIEEYEQWFHGADGILTSGHHNSEAAWKQALQKYIADSVESQETLYRLVAILHPVLERNINLEAAIRFKTFLSEHIRRTGGLIEEVLPTLRGGKGLKLLVQLQALIVGFANISQPAPVLRQAIEEQGFGEFQVDFKSWFSEAVNIFLNGLLTTRGAIHDNE